MKTDDEYRYGPYWSRLHDATPGQLSAVGHPALGEGFNREAYGLRLAAAERLLRRCLSAGPDSVLEGAVGVGAYATLWRRLGVTRWVGVDISRAAVQRLRREHPGHGFVDGDLAEEAWTVGLDGEGFDLVTAVDVLFHLVDDAAFGRALENLCRVSAPGGALLVSDVFAPKASRSAPHVRHRPLEAYEAILQRHGLALTGREPVFAILDDPIPRPGRHPFDRLLRLGWRLVAGSLRVLPRALRDPVGAAVVKALRPVDRALCRAGLTVGVNLELAIFSSPKGSTPGLDAPVARNAHATGRNTADPTGGD